MANKLKKKTAPPPDPAKLKQDKEAQVTVKEVVKDERTTKIAGAVSLLASIFLFMFLSGTKEVSLNSLNSVNIFTI